MLSSGETAELRELQRRAYAPGGGLLAEDAARLNELEDKRVAAVAPPVDAEDASAAPVNGTEAEAVGSARAGGAMSGARAVDPGAPAIAAEASGTGRSLPDTDAGATVADAEGPSGGAVPAARSRRRLPWVSLAAGAAALLVGLGAGWVLSESRRAPASLEITAEQQARGEQIAPEGTDPGSVIALRERGDVVAWYATKNSGETTCLILDGGGDDVETSCAIEASLASMPLSNLIEVETGSDDGLDVTYATLTFTPDQRPAVTIDGYRGQMPPDELYESDEEADIAASLREAGYRADSIYVVGYHGDDPLWTAQRGTREECLVYVQPDGVPLDDCSDFGDGAPDLLTLEFVSERDGIVYDVVAQADSLRRSPVYLTITETPVGVTDVDVETGEVVDEASGDAG